MYTPLVPSISIVGGYHFFAQGIRFMLQSLPNTKETQISIYQNGSSFLEANETCDVVLLNIMMSDYSGTRFAEILKTKYPACKVIIMSLKDDIDLSNCIASSADGFLSSQFNEKELEFAISTVISGEAYVSSGMVVRLLREKAGKKRRQFSAGKKVA